MDNGQWSGLPRRKAKKARLIDRGPENRQHGNKPYFTRVSLSFSTGNTEATGGNMLLDSVRFRHSDWQFFRTLAFSL